MRHLKRTRNTRRSTSVQLPSRNLQSLLLPSTLEQRWWLKTIAEVRVRLTDLGEPITR